MPTGTVVVEVEAVAAVQLLAVVLIRLNRTARAHAHQTTERIVVVHLLHLPLLVCHHTHAAEVVSQIIMHRHIVRLVYQRIPHGITHKHRAVTRRLNVLYI